MEDKIYEDKIYEDKISEDKISEDKISEDKTGDSDFDDWGDDDILSQIHLTPLLQKKVPQDKTTPVQSNTTSPSTPITGTAQPRRQVSHIS